MVVDLSFDICIDVIIKINKQTCQVWLIVAISVIDTKIDKDDTNYLIFPVFFHCKQVRRGTKGWSIVELWLGCLYNDVNKIDLIRFITPRSAL